MFRKFITFLKRFKFLIIILLIIAVILFLKSKPKVISVTSSHPVRKNITKFVNASGKTNIDNKYSVYAKVSANIQKITVINGTLAKTGDSILTFDPASLKASMETTWTGYVTALSNLDSNYTDIIAAEADLKAKKLLRDHAQENYNSDRTGKETKEGLRTAESNFATAEADLETLKAKKTYLAQSVNSTYSSFQSAKQNLNNTSLISPADGVVALNGINEGQAVVSGQKLFSIITAGTIEFSADVDETDIKDTNIGQKVEVILDSFPDKPIIGTVSEIAASTKTTDSGGTAVDVTIQLAKSEVKPILGLNGEAKINVQEKNNALVVPIDYVYEDADGSYVWKLMENGKAAKWGVTTGLTTDDEEEILNGLVESDTILKGDNIKMGSKVRITNANKN